MALPAIADSRRTFAGAHLAVAARPQVAPLFTMVDGVDAVMTLSRAARLWRADGAGATMPRAGAGRFDTAMLFPNSFAAAWIASRGRHPRAMGIRRRLARPLLTRAVAGRRGRLHQAAYYQALTAALGLPPGRAWRAVVVPGCRATGAATLLRVGHVGRAVRRVCPGAAYGRAKQWLPERFAELADALVASAAGAS